MNPVESFCRDHFSLSFFLFAIYIYIYIYSPELLHSKNLLTTDLDPCMWGHFKGSVNQITSYTVGQLH